MRLKQYLAVAMGLAAVALSVVASTTAEANAPRVAATAELSTNPCGTATTPPTSYQHVIWILFEDNTLSSVVGNTAAPFITSLAAQCAYTNHWLDNVINNASNYVPAVAGANCDSGTLNAVTPPGDTCLTQGTSPAAKCTPSSCKNTVAIPSIFEQLQDSAGGTWKSYDEGMPANCATSNSGPKSAPYLVRHNPAPYLSDLRIVGQHGGNTCATNDIAIPPTGCNGTSCTPNKTSNGFYSDITGNTLPSFSFVTPDACNDMHNKCSPYKSRVTNGDQWLSAWLPIIAGSPEYLSGSTAVFIMWDEGSFGSPLPNVIVAPSVHPGTVISDTMNNIAALRGTEDMLGLGHIGCATGTQGDGSPCPNGSTANLPRLFNLLP
jgi:hypothetical protein